MGHVQTGWHKKGTDVQVEVQDKLREVQLTPMPFVKMRYWEG